MREVLRSIEDWHWRRAFSVVYCNGVFGTGEIGEREREK
jgi:hypothetical protein